MRQQPASLCVLQMLPANPICEIVVADSGEVGLLHFECGLTSYNAEDIKHVYCGFCHKWLKDEMKLLTIKKKYQKHL